MLWGGKFKKHNNIYNIYIYNTNVIVTSSTGGNISF